MTTRSKTRTAPKQRAASALTRVPSSARTARSSSAGSSREGSGANARRSPNAGALRSAKTPSSGVRQQQRPSELDAALAWLEGKGTTHDRENLARFGITAGKAFGVSIANIQVLAKRLGRNHELAAALWKSGWYEARLLTSFVDDPARVTPAQMDRWTRDFDNWGICDTVCFHLFDRTAHAFDKVEQWAASREEFVRRAAFALLASLALHDKDSADERFVRCLPLIEAAAGDERNFVKKGVSWALRAVGRRSLPLHAAAVTVARRLSTAPGAAARWVGKDALRELTRAAITQRLAAQRRA